MSDHNGTGFEPLVHRLVKRDRHLRKWARREGIDVWRVYDRDIPEFPLLVDRVGEAAVVGLQIGGRLLDYTEEQLGDWLAGALAAVSEGLGVSPDEIFLKRRERQKGSSQYSRQDRAGVERVVGEGELRFWVNLTDYLDIGLFADHRITRRWLCERSRGLRVLNLFCYTGALSVAALAGSAAQVTSVDLSNTYLDWAYRNVALNRLDHARHVLIRADVLKMLATYAPEPADLILLDPPSFSNSKAMEQTLDIQRDHGWLLGLCGRWLAPGGQLWFSTNRKGFRLDSGLSAEWEIQDWTASSTPKDFERRAPHQLFALSLREDEG